MWLKGTNFYVSNEGVVSSPKAWINYSKNNPNGSSTLVGLKKMCTKADSDRWSKPQSF